MDPIVKNLEDIIHLEPSKYRPFFVDRQLAVLWGDITRNRSIHTLKKFERMLSSLADHEEYYKSKMEKMKILLKQVSNGGIAARKAVCIKSAKTLIWIHVITKFINVFRKNQEDFIALQNKYAMQNVTYKRAMQARKLKLPTAVAVKLAQFRRQISRCITRALQPLHIPSQYAVKSVSILDPPRDVRIHLMKAVDDHNDDVYYEYKFNRNMGNCEINGQEEIDDEMTEDEDEDVEMDEDSDENEENGAYPQMGIAAEVEVPSENDVKMDQDSSEHEQAEEGEIPNDYQLIQL